MAARVFCTPNATGEQCGHGVCDSLGVSCACFEGYEHDLIQRLHPNCYFPTAAKQIGLTIVGCMGVLAMAWAAYEMRLPRKGLALSILRISFAGGLFSAAYAVSLGLESRHGPASIAFMVLLFVTVALVGLEHLLRSMLSPIFAVSKQDPKFHFWLLRAGLFVFAIVYTCTWLAALVFYVQNSPGAFNLAVTAAMIVAGVEAAFVLAVVTTTLNKLLRTIKTTTGAVVHLKYPIQEAASAASTNLDDPVMHYGRQATRMSFRLSSLCLMVMAVAVAVCTLDFVLEIYPYRWLMFLIISSGLPGLCLVMIAYCNRSLSKTSSNKGESATMASKELAAYAGGSATAGSVGPAASP